MLRWNVTMAIRWSMVFVGRLTSAVEIIARTVHWQKTARFARWISVCLSVRGRGRSIAAAAVSIRGQVGRIVVRTRAARKMYAGLKKEKPASTNAVIVRQGLSAAQMICVRTCALQNTAAVVITIVRPLKVGATADARWALVNWIRAGLVII